MLQSRRASRTPIPVDDDVLLRYPLPDSEAGTSKDGRGAILVVGGSRETPGGVRLAGEAALRVGAGRLTLATVDSVASALSIAVPEARVIALDETAAGALDPDASPERLRSCLSDFDVVLVGPGTCDPGATEALLAGLFEGVCDDTLFVIDAAAIPALRHDLRAVGPMVVLPNPREAAALLDTSEDAVCQEPAVALDAMIEALGCPIALRGPDTWLAHPESDEVFVDRSGIPALATAGSGDVATGAVSGLLARGAEPTTAMLWGLHAHATAARSLSGPDGHLGFLARDFCEELPCAMRLLARDHGS